MTQTTRDLIEIAIEQVKLNGGTIIIEDEKTNKCFEVFNNTSNEVKIRIV